jgi:hypothetical protein
MAVRDRPRLRQDADHAAFLPSPAPSIGRGEIDRGYSAVTLRALGPLSPLSASKETFAPSASDL